MRLDFHLFNLIEVKSKEKLKYYQKYKNKIKFVTQVLKYERLKIRLKNVTQLLKYAKSDLNTKKCDLSINVQKNKNKKDELAMKRMTQV